MTKLLEDKFEEIDGKTVMIGEKLISFCYGDVCMLFWKTSESEKQRH